MGFLSSIIGIGTSLFGADAAAKTAKRQIKSNEAMLGRQIEQVAPFRDAGAGAINPLKDAYGLGDSNAAMERFKASPEYQLNYENMMRDGEQNVQAYGAGSGNLFSGGTLKALQDRAGRIGNQLFGNYTSNLFSLAGMGANAATNNATNMGSAEGRNQTGLANQGNAKVAGILGAGQGLQDMFDSKQVANLFGGGASSFGG